MLFMPTDAAKPRRLQGSYVSDLELEKIVQWWTDGRFRHLAPEKLDHLLDEATEGDAEQMPPEDPLFDAAKDLAQQHSRVSTSLLQRRLHVGYPRAARLVDMLEAAGIVGPAEGGQSRIVLAHEENSGHPDTDIVDYQDDTGTQAEEEVYDDEEYEEEEEDFEAEDEDEEYEEEEEEEDAPDDEVEDDAEEGGLNAAHDDDDDDEPPF